MVARPKAEELEEEMPRVEILEEEVLKVGEPEAEVPGAKRWREKAPGAKRPIEEVSESLTITAATAVRFWHCFSLFYYLSFLRDPLLHCCYH